MDSLHRSETGELLEQAAAGLARVDAATHTAAHATARARPGGVAEQLRLSLGETMNPAPYTVELGCPLPRVWSPLRNSDL
jgi:hypothetical protein